MHINMDEKEEDELKKEVMLAVRVPEGHQGHGRGGRYNGTEPVRKAIADLLEQLQEWRRQRWPQNRRED